MTDRRRAHVLPPMGERLRSWSIVLAAGTALLVAACSGTSTATSNEPPQIEVPFPVSRGTGRGPLRIYRAGSCELFVRVPPERPIAGRGARVSARTVQISGRPFELVRYETVLSPPPVGPHTTGSVDPANYRPQTDVLTVGSTEIAIPRTGHGACTDADAAAILEGLRIRSPD